MSSEKMKPYDANEISKIGIFKTGPIEDNSNMGYIKVKINPSYLHSLENHRGNQGGQT